MLQMENMVGEVIQGTLMETVRAVGGRKQWEENVKALHVAKMQSNWWTEIVYLNYIVTLFH